jgi:NhaP-type Na+/H+ or K+/H+ antiporter
MFMTAKRGLRQLRVNARKSDRRSLTLMLVALVAITMLADGIGLIVHYGFTFRHAVAHGMPVAHDLTTASSHIR